MTVSEDERARLSTERDRVRDTYLAPREQRPATAARGIHHTALISGDVTRTVEFYQNVLGFPLIEMFENRDLPGSTHFFFDVGHGNALAFFDLPGVDPGEYAEVLGGLHHLAISVTRENWDAARSRLDAEGVPYQEESGSSIYLRDPDGARIELIADPLGEMYGHPVG
ncbi:VOC family protein [Pseudonocardia acaciae]|uniref:VOC family protein n=1 Tax=Pseudonocardia acaciae TaxID=551276 RepID=UPI0004903DBC|nr:VOC family protein [Pseudonocardia acaciae]